MTQKLYFLADDKQDHADLWVTDGTTTQAVGGLGNISVSGVSTDGLGPEFITALGQQMIFAGEDALDDTASNGIWLTDGTPNGTKETGGVSLGSGHASAIANADPNGLNPTDFVVFGSKALFFGLDTASFTGLWSTDGTVANTLELGGSENGQIVGRGTNWDPQNFFASNDEVLFDAYDSTGGDFYIGLWITDGTSAGTIEIGGAQNAAIYDSGVSNFEAIDFIQLGAFTLFDAPNKAGDAALWITDGTAAGTVEVGGVGNAGIVGAGKNTDFGDGLSQAVRFGARIFMSGPDNDGSTGLWTTDGTAPGTIEVGGLDDGGLTTYGQHPSSVGLHPTDLTVNGQQVLFDGTDAIGYRELWASDGTATGTYEIGGEGVGGFLPNEASDGLDPSSIVSLGGGKAVFIGQDDSNNQNSGKPTLWVTNGTFAGTEEIGGSDNLGVKAINPTGFDFTSELIGGDSLAYFVGEDEAGDDVLWETDGTANGTNVVAASDGNALATGLDPSGLALANPPAAENNFSGGGQNLNLNAIPGESVDLSSTANVWDTVTGSNGTIGLSAAQAFAIGGGLLITMAGVGSAVQLSKTSGNKNSIYGTKGAITLNGAQANVYGEQDITFASGTAGNVVHLFDTDGKFDSLNGSNGAIYLESAQLALTGNDDTITFIGSGNTLSFSAADTNDNVLDYSPTDDTLELSGGVYLAADPHVGAPSSFTLSVSGDTVTQINSDGSKQVTTYNITGQSFNTKALDYDPTGLVITKYYEGVTGNGNLSSFEYLYGGNNLIGSDYFYSGITGKPYTAEEVDYDGSFRLTSAAYTGVTGEPYSSFEYDYAGGVFAGSQFTYTSVPAGASYLFYEVDYNQANALLGEKFFFTNLTGLGYTNSEEDFDANGNLTRDIVGGLTGGQPYFRLEEDFSAGSYEGYKAFYAITGTYTNEEVNVSASNVLERAVYTGASSSIEEDYANGSLDGLVYGFTDVTGQTYNAYQVTETAGGTALREVFDLNSGGHTQVALSPGQTLTSQGLDKMTGDGATRFVLDAIYGADTITNFTGADIASLSSQEYAELGSTIQGGNYSGGNATLTFGDGDTLTFKNMTEASLENLTARFT